VFRSAVAATLPLLVGGFSIVGTFLVLKVVASVTDVSIFALNLTTAMGLGLAIDYSLLFVSRYREERAKGLQPNAAVVHTVGSCPLVDPGPGTTPYEHVLRFAGLRAWDPFVPVVLEPGDYVNSERLRAWNSAADEVITR
jgi:hypothetical protein